tara:strand:- start:114 stop:524 length:411 start_codon:yes stop_codon:yes gene_type:complete
MKLNENKLKQIINEEMMMLDDKKHMDHVDEEGGMAKSQLYKIAKYAMMLHDSLDDEDQLEAWVQSKITIASEYIGKVKHYLEYEMGLDMDDPDDCGDSMDSEEEIQDKLPDAEPMMVMHGEEAYEIDDEDAKLMES